MAIEKGLELLIQAGLGSPPIASGGFFVQLPKDFITAANPMAWTYRFLISNPTYTLDTQDGFTAAEIRIDCHGFTAAHAIQLANAIAVALRPPAGNSGAWSGTLPDSDATVVQGIFQSGNAPDGYSDLNRSFVRTLEFLVNYNDA